MAQKQTHTATQAVAHRRLHSLTGLLYASLAFLATAYTLVYMFIYIFIYMDIYVLYQHLKYIFSQVGAKKKKLPENVLVKGSSGHSLLLSGY